MARTLVSLVSTVVVAGLALASFAAAAAPVVVNDDFASGTRGWSALFVDHPPGVETEWQFASGLRPLPDELGIAAQGFMITGNNHSDDLGMALKKRLGAADGIVPNATYWVDFEITFASNAASQSVGVGGSPGDSVYLKAGASPTEPAAALETQSNHLRPTVNVGFQSMGGPAASGAGTIANGRDASLPAQFVRLVRPHRHRFPVRAAADGTLWLLVMTDSAFEGPTTLYYLSIKATLTPVELGSGRGLINLSTRAPVGSGEHALIAGFVVDGPGTAPLLVRAVGPGLAEFGLGGLLADPRLDVMRGTNVLLATNDNWTESTSPDALRTAFVRAGAFPLADGSKDAALLQSLSAGSHSAIVRGAGTTDGLALVELYHLPESGDTSRVINLSTRGLAGTDANAMIAGVIIGGTAPERLLIRAVGPGLAAFGILEPAQQPVVTVWQGDEPIATNGGWDAINPGAEIAVAAQAAGAFALTPGSRDSALLLTLSPGVYTIVVQEGAPTVARTALVEVYHVP